MGKLLISKERIIERPSVWLKYQANKHHMETGHRCVPCPSHVICNGCDFLVPYEFRNDAGKHIVWDDEAKEWILSEKGDRVISEPYEVEDWEDSTFTV